MARQHAVPVGTAPRWILLIRLNLIGTQTRNTAQGTQVSSKIFRNPNLVHGPDGEVVMVTPAQPMIQPGLNEDLVFAQDLRRERLLAEIHRLTVVHDVRNLSDLDDPTLYGIIQELIFNPTFFEPGIARILHCEDHPLHVRTLVAVYGLLNLAASQGQKQKTKGSYDKNPRAPVQSPDKIRVFNIVVYDQEVDFPDAADQQALLTNPWAKLRPTRADPTDLNSQFTFPSKYREPLAIQISGRPTLLKILRAFWLLGGPEGVLTNDGPRLLPTSIVGYMDWDPAEKPENHSQLWPTKLATGGYHPIGAERHLTGFLESLSFAHTANSKDLPDPVWLGFLMHTPQTYPQNRRSQSDSWPNMISSFGDLDRYTEYRPWVLPLLSNHRSQSAEEKKALFLIDPAHIGVTHPYEAPPQLDPVHDDEVFGDLPATATTGPLQVYYSNLDTAWIRAHDRQRKVFLERIELDLARSLSEAESQRDSRLQDLDAQQIARLAKLEEEMQGRRDEHRAETQKMLDNHEAEIRKLREMRLNLAKGYGLEEQEAREKIRDSLFKGVDFGKLTEAFIHQHRSTLRAPEASESPFAAYSPSRIGRNVATSIVNSFPGRLLFPPSKEQQVENREAEIERQLEKLDGEEGEIKLAIVREEWAIKILKDLKAKRAALQDEKRELLEGKRRQKLQELREQSKAFMERQQKELAAHNLDDIDLGDLGFGNIPTGSKKRTAAELEQPEDADAKKARREQETEDGKQRGGSQEKEDESASDMDLEKEVEGVGEKAGEQSKAGEVLGGIDNQGNAGKAAAANGTTTAGSSGSSNRSSELPFRNRPAPPPRDYYNQQPKLQKTRRSKLGLPIPPLTTEPSGIYLEHQLGLPELSERNIRMTARSCEKQRLAKSVGEDWDDIYSEFSYESDTDVE